MGMKSDSRKAQRTIRHRRVRRKVSGTPERPRMAIAVSNKHMYVQFVDDMAGHTLASSSTSGGEGVDVQKAADLGRKAAASAMDRGIRSVVVDRGGFAFHGRVKAMVDAAVAAGLSISVKPAKEEQ